MNVKDYVQKYHLDKKKHFSYKTFLNDLGKDFGVLLQSYPKATLTEEQFRSIVKELKQKFDSISNKAIYGIPDKIWNYFYATTIINKKNKIFSTKKSVKRFKKDYLIK